MLQEINRTLQLRYDPGQFTFRHFSHHATDAELYDLVQHINAFQEDEVKQVVRVVTLELR